MTPTIPLQPRRDSKKRTRREKAEVAALVKSAVWTRDDHLYMADRDGVRTMNGCLREIRVKNGTFHEVQLKSGHLRKIRVRNHLRRGFPPWENPQDLRCLLRALGLLKVPARNSWHYCPVAAAIKAPAKKGLRLTVQVGTRNKTGDHRGVALLKRRYVGLNVINPRDDDALAKASLLEYKLHLL